MDDRRTGEVFELIDAIVWFTVRQSESKKKTKNKDKGTALARI